MAELWKKSWKCPASTKQVNPAFVQIHTQEKSEEVGRPAWLRPLTLRGVRAADAAFASYA